MEKKKFLMRGIICLIVLALMIMPLYARRRTTSTSTPTPNAPAATPTTPAASTPTPPQQTGTVVTLYQHCDYGGYSAGFGAGSYNLSALQSAGVLNDDVSSVRVTAGYQVTLYADDNYGGSTLTLTGDASCLVNNGFNDLMSSVRIQVASASENPPAPPPLTESRLTDFINNHILYEGGSPTTYTSDFRVFVQLEGGDAFLTNMLNKYPNTVLDITSSYTGAAASSGGNTWYSKSFWDSSPDRRVPTLMHEYVHHLDNGSGAQAYYNAASSTPSMQWDSYAMTNPAEYIACGFEWVVRNDPYDANETKRERLKRMDPNFYYYLIRDFIPNKMYKVQ
ncbi:MAG: hypothetical protein JW969_05585 [Spirochaetales bacterium]|nr:hypothetical protein [Spirochaetales bacterium]